MKHDSGGKDGLRQHQDYARSGKVEGESSNFGVTPLRHSMVTHPEAGGYGLGHLDEGSRAVGHVKRGKGMHSAQGNPDHGPHSL